jgi:caa(3)-type oxidase subunit IV
MATTEKGHTNYLAVGAALIVLTFLEVLTVNLPIPPAPFLILFGALKALLIAMFFMHLKVDRRMFAGIFAIGVLGAIAMIVTLVLLLTAQPT